MSEKRYDEQYKREAVKLVSEQGLTKAEAGRRLGVAGTTIANWLKAYATPAQAEAGQQVQHELARLREENRQLRMEREILEKATAFFARGK